MTVILGALMYCLGFVLASATSFSGHAGWKLLLGASYIGLQAVMLPPLVLGRSTMLIYVLLDSIPARKIFPDAATWPTVLPIYYGLLAAFLRYSVYGFFRRNQKRYYNNRRIKAKLKGLPPAIHRQQALSAA